MRQAFPVPHAEADRAVEMAMAAAAEAVSGALRAGTRVPGFQLRDTRGNAVSLDQLLMAGPVVLNFFRGAWCAFGEESLARLAATYSLIANAAAAALAIAPPTARTSADRRLPIPELVDVDMKVARSFGLAFELPAELRQRYLDLGYVPPRTRRASTFLVPIPATYLIDQEGMIVLAHIDPDYRHHPQNEALLSALQALRARSMAREKAARRPGGKRRFGRDG